MSLSLTFFITCFLCTNILCIILHYLIYKKKYFLIKVYVYILDNRNYITKDGTSI